MLTLNLASEELKKEIKLRHIYNLIRKIGLVLITTTILVTTILLVAKIILQNNFNEIVAQTTLVTKNNQGYNSKVREINNKINFIAKIQSEFVFYSDTVKNLADITPDDVNFYLLNVSYGSKTIKIKGRAGTRDNLLIFKKNFEQLPHYENIDFPLKNLLEKNNIDFEINAKIKI